MLVWGQAHFGAVLQGGPDAAERGALGNRALFVLRELLRILPNWEGLQPEATAFLSAALQAANAVAGSAAGVPLGLLCLVFLLADCLLFVALKTAAAIVGGDTAGTPLLLHGL